MTLHSLELKGYKSIKEISIQFNPINILIGANGAGKTNFISFFKLLNSIIDNRLQLDVRKEGGANAILHYGIKNTEYISSKVSFGPNSYSFVLDSTNNDTFYFLIEHANFHKEGYGQPYDALLGSSGHIESLLKSRSINNQCPVCSHIIDSIKEWRVYHFHDTSSTASVKKPGNINDNAFFRYNAENLAAFLFLLKHQYNKIYENIRKTIRIVFPFFDDFYLRPDPFNENVIKLEWHEKGSDYPFGAYNLSDGTLRFICLTTLLLQPKKYLPSVIIIDEPELGLHPLAITILASLIKNAALNTQIIISTQSVNLVNHFDAEDILVVDRDRDQTRINRLSSDLLEDWLKDYNLGELWEKNIIGGRPSW
ncbi:AAA family ATPase [Methanospirillum purgamenti]|jgi:predicted ATPase|uniref:AAA family ATPase n=1 Tax=Methanospirillum hungatei TaxID=2203 RepID=A0A8F5VQ91_METHU|nr:AAA family ATPase [Methanospirillum hungatei]QXO95193.1 AAA family ATPase [Methanospirillum hungatei]